MNSKINHPHLLLATAVVFLAIPYFYLNAWWKFFPSFVGICSIGYLSDKSKWRTHLGLNTEKVSYKKTMSIFAGASATAALSLMLVMKFENISYLKQGFTLYKTMPVIQSLNEEIVLRAMLFKFCLDRHWCTKTFSVAMAIVFALIHVAMYLITEGLLIQIGAFTTLFLFSYSLNRVYLVTSSILPTFAIHCSWNLFRFSNSWIDIFGNLLSEGESFSMIEGSGIVVTLASILFVFRNTLAKSFLKDQKIE